MGFSKSSSKREVYSDTIIPQETRKILNRQLKQIEKEEQPPPPRQSQQKERNHKNQSRNKWKRNEGNNRKD